MFYKILTPHKWIQKKAWNLHLPVPHLEAFALPNLKELATRSPRRIQNLLSCNIISGTRVRIRIYDNGVPK